MQLGNLKKLQAHQTTRGNNGRKGDGENKKVNDTVQNEKPKRRRGRKPGTQPDKLPDLKKEQMFYAWCQKQSDKHVSHVCQVHPQTVKRYRIKYDWATKLADMRRDLDESGANLEEIKKQRILEMRNIQTLMLEFIRGTKRIKPHDAAKVYFQAYQLEMELRGHLSPKEEGLLALAAKRFQLEFEREERLRKKKEIPAKVTDVNDTASKNAEKVKDSDEVNGV